MNFDEYTALDATGLAATIAAGDLTAAEAAELATDAINAVNEEINAVAGGPFGRPLAYADDGCFAGVPFVIKDLICHAEGVPTRMGTRMLGDGLVPPADTHLMERFRAAGLATVAVSTTPEFGFNANTEALAYGSTRNPWDTGRSAGGSSGGSAALVAAGAVPMAHANDGGGSIRIPAACNGLVGLKPSRGRVPLGPDLDSNALSGLAAEFAVTRSVRDAAALLDAVAVPYPGDRVLIAPPRRPFAQEVGADPGRLRIALHTEAWSGTAVDPEVVAAVEAVGRALEAAGHRVDRVAPAFDWESFLEATVTTWAAFLAESVAAVEAMTGTVAGPDSVEATSWACIQYGRELRVLDLAAAGAVFTAVSRTVGEFFTGYDVLLTPTTNHPPMELGYLNADEHDLDAHGWTRRIFDAFSFTPLFNTTGTPAISLPLGQSSEGLPIGVQLAGPMCSESMLLRLAAQLEAAMPWAGRTPAVHASRI
ncbi:amidase family protein [Gordonia sp. PP30]|uniref:amidase n=1 Tax=Gordonia sp. PP30 TaxID=2935861 RepID=UPI001FFF1ACD|nr:amidase family protein [Gordonia sp. PP30]UQE75947.1 amidase family protein [Gordonia sp. PP30]